MARGRTLPRLLSQSLAQSILEENGWVRTLGGKHVVKMEKPGHRPITLPYNKGQVYSVGLSQRILKEAGLKDEQPVVHPNGD